MMRMRGRAGLWLAPSFLLFGLAVAGRVRDVPPEVLAAHPEVIAQRERVAAAPKDANLHHELGNIYARLGWDELAADAWHDATKADKSHYGAWTNLSSLAIKNGDFEAAGEAAQHAIRAQPLAAQAYYNLGIVEDARLNYDAAMEAFLTAVRLDPKLYDPAVNPGIVNNKHLTTIRLQDYLRSGGSAALPLLDASATGDEGLRLGPAAAAAPAAATPPATAPAVAAPRPPVAPIVLTNEPVSPPAPPAPPAPPEKKILGTLQTRRPPARGQSAAPAETTPPAKPAEPPGP